MNNFILYVMNSDLYFDAKLFISSKRAAKISGYVNDYIGQLCRDGKIEARMVGRSWYVALESLIAHKNAFVSGTKSKPSFFYKNVTLIPALPEFEIAHAKNLEAIESIASKSQESSPVVSSVSSQFVLPVLLLPAPKALSIDVLDEDVPVTVSISSVADNLVDEKVFVETVSEKSDHSFVFTFGRTFPKLVAFMLALVISASGFIAIESTNDDARKERIAFEQNISQVFNRKSDTLEASVFSVAKRNFNLVAQAVYGGMSSAWIKTKNTIIVAVGGEPIEVESKKVVATAPKQGLVVIPESKVDDRAKTIADIKRTFSDEVAVNPDEDGSGVITPVFRETQGDDYLYVLVPIRN